LSNPEKTQQPVNVGEVVHKMIKQAANSHDVSLEGLANSLAILMLGSERRKMMASNLLAPFILSSGSKKPIHLTVRIHAAVKEAAGMAGTDIQLYTSALFALAVADDELIQQAVRLIKHCKLGGAGTMADRGW
jgi:hypothetical protein